MHSGGVFTPLGEFVGVDWERGLEGLNWAWIFVEEYLWW